MGWTVAAAVVGGMISSNSASKSRKASSRASRNALEFQKEQAALLEKQKDVYRKMTFENPYLNMENVFEDITVNQQQAQFQAQQGAQQRADILGGLRETAGAAGIAGLAQVLANQGQLQSQRISADIGRQEAQNRLLAAKGAAAVEMAERGGEAWVQQAEMDRQATLLGMQQGQSAGANAALQQAYSNQMTSNIYSRASEQDAWMNAFKAVGGMDWGGGGGTSSGRKKGGFGYEGAPV